MNQERLLQVILSPHVSEKAAIAVERRNEYVFEVRKDATKREIKDAVEKLFSTKVKSVHTLAMRAKRKIFKGVPGKQRKGGSKKAYVTLMPDQKLDIVEVK
jgi:large subunit ribosomal protein L23